MKTILFTDTHFGVKQNSIHWLESQLNFIYNQLIPYIKELRKTEEVNLVHLGDVFDSRSSISPLVATKVKAAFKELAECSNQFTIIAGNHDFYSPTSDEVDSIHLVLGDVKGIEIVSQNLLVGPNNSLYVPWYKWFDQGSLQRIIEDFKIKTIFTHADIVSEKVEITGPIIYSGHIHIPKIRKKLRNLGSCYALNFADANSERGFYEISEDGFLKFIPNTESIRFWRLYDAEIFDIDKTSQLSQKDYIELYITDSRMQEVDYQERINQLVKFYKNIWVIPKPEQSINEVMDTFEGYDISNITSHLIPENLTEKFNTILNKVKEL